MKPRNLHGKEKPKDNKIRYNKIKTVLERKRSYFMRVCINEKMRKKHDDEFMIKQTKKIIEKTTVKFMRT